MLILPLDRAQRPERPDKCYQCRTVKGTVQIVRTFSGGRWVAVVLCDNHANNWGYIQNTVTYMSMR